jgi:hypothetical protein
MRKTSLHLWITMLLCALAVATEALTSGSLPPLF